jgi:hypothetical protein
LSTKGTTARAASPRFVLTVYFIPFSSYPKSTHQVSIFLAKIKYSPSFYILFPPKCHQPARQKIPSQEICEGAHQEKRSREKDKLSKDIMYMDHPAVTNYRQH